MSPFRRLLTTSRAACNHLRRRLPFRWNSGGAGPVGSGGLLLTHRRALVLIFLGLLLLLIFKRKRIRKGKPCDKSDSRDSLSGQPVPSEVLPSTLLSHSEAECQKLYETFILDSADGPFEIVIVKSEFTLYLLGKADVAGSFPAAVGSNPDLGDKKSPRDRRTPEGVFRIVSREKSSHWKVNDRFCYGPWFLRLDTGSWKGIGIHGTDDPSSIGRASSHGCIKVEHNLLEQLCSLPLGTKVTIVRNLEQLMEIDSRSHSLLKASIQASREGRESRGV